MENLLITLGPWAITLIIGIVAYFIKEYVKNTKEEFKIFKEQLLINADEHREIMVSIAKLTEHLPDILDCEVDLKNLKKSDTKQWSKIDEHDDKLKKLVA